MYAFGKFCSSTLMKSTKLHLHTIASLSRRRTSWLSSFKDARFTQITRDFSISELGSRPPSYVYGDSTTNKTLTYTTIGEELERAADLYGDKDAVVVCHQGIRKTFTEYKKDIDCFAAGLLALDFHRGDRIAIWCPNNYEWALSQFATAKLGLILTTLNPAYQSTEFADCFNKVRARGLIMTDKFKTQDFYKLVTAVAPELVDCQPGNTKTQKLPSLEKVIMISDQNFPGTFKFEDVLKEGENSSEKETRRRVEAIQKEMNADDTIMIAFTSGTTSKPKAIELSHHNLINGCHIQAHRLELDDKTKEHRLCVITPLFHAIASVGGTLNGLVNGLCVVFPSTSFNAALTLKALQEEKCTSLAGTPTMFIDILRHPNFSRTDLSSLRTGVMGGASCPPLLVKAVATKMHCPGLTLGYGCTEVSGAVFLQTHDDPLNEKLTSDGRITDFMEAKIVDDKDQMVPMGTQGEICVRGYKVMNGYWDDDEKTREVMKNRWFYTGDIGILKEDKTVKLVDRKKDIIIRGGENIAPREIEEHLIEQPNIEEAHVIGVPDDRMGEEVCAWIKVKEGQTLTQEEVRKRCQGNISHFKIPRYVKFVQGFPKTPTGKVQKSLMREAMRNEMTQQ